MHPIMQIYINRFAKIPTKSWDYFFTQLAKEDLAKLPYINQVEKFCRRLAQAIEKGEKICIYSDYDTDAVTATATMYWGLLELGVKRRNLSFYAPDRFREGYGLNVEAAASLAKEHDLLITVDCGINSCAEASAVKAAGGELIITDHHALTGTIPECTAVVNCRLNVLPLTLPVDNEFGLNLEKLTLLPETVTGVGVAWFTLVWLAYYLRDVEHRDVSPKVLNSLLPYVAIGTIADCQSIVEPVNRLLVKTGLTLLQSPVAHPGLEELTKQTGLREKTTQGYSLSSQDLAFTYAPILNASGRIAHASKAIQTLITADAGEAATQAQELLRINENRKKLVKSILAEVESKAAQQKEAKVIWLQGEWNKGVIGLLASRLVNQYEKPVIVVTKHEDLAAASLRAPEGYHLPDTMQNFTDLFVKSGGHPGAAGFEARFDSLEAIRQGFETHLPEGVTNPYTDSTAKTTLPESLLPIIPHRARILLKTTPETDLLKEVLRVDPYGQDFPYPELVFALPHFHVRFLGKDSNHAKLTAATATVTIFNLSPALKTYLLEADTQKKQLWVGAKVSQNTWANRTKLELIANNYWLA